MGFGTSIWLGGEPANTVKKSRLSWFKNSAVLRPKGDKSKVDAVDMFMSPFNCESDSSEPSILDQLSCSGGFIRPGT